MLTPLQVATELKLSVVYVRRLCDSGEIEAHNFGMGANNYYRIAPVALERYREKRKVNPAKKKP